MGAASKRNQNIKEKKSRSEQNGEQKEYTDTEYTEKATTKKYSKR